MAGLLWRAIQCGTVTEKNNTVRQSYSKEPQSPIESAVVLTSLCCAGQMASSRLAVLRHQYQVLHYCEEQLCSNVKTYSAELWRGLLEYCEDHFCSAVKSNFAIMWRPILQNGEKCWRIVKISSAVFWRAVMLYNVQYCEVHLCSKVELLSCDVLWSWVVQWSCAVELCLTCAFANLSCAVELCSKVVQ